MTLRFVVAVLVFLGSLGLLNSTRAESLPFQIARISTIRVETALTQRGWLPTAAVSAASTVPVYLTDSYLGTKDLYVNALLIERCPASLSVIYLDVAAVSQAEIYIGREFQRWIEWQAGNCNYDKFALMQNISTLTEYTDFIQTYLNTARNTDYFNHDLARYIKYQFNSLPNAYRTKYFPYSADSAYPPPVSLPAYPDPRPVRSPTVVPYPAPVELAYPAPINRMILPRV